MHRQREIKKKGREVYIFVILLHAFVVFSLFVLLSLHLLFLSLFARVSVQVKVSHLINRFSLKFKDMQLEANYQIHQKKSFVKRLVPW